MDTNGRSHWMLSQTHYAKMDSWADLLTIDSFMSHWKPLEDITDPRTPTFSKVRDNSRALEEQLLGWKVDQ